MLRSSVADSLSRSVKIVCREMPSSTEPQKDGPFSTQGPAQCWMLRYEVHLPTVSRMSDRTPRTPSWSFDEGTLRNNYLLPVRSKEAATEEGSVDPVSKSAFGFCRFLVLYASPRIAGGLTVTNRLSGLVTAGLASDRKL